MPSAHGVWKLKLRGSVDTGKSETDVATATRDDCCHFGKWLRGPTIDACTRTSQPYADVYRLHREFHQTAGRVLDMALHGKRDLANDLLEGEFTKRSSRLSLAIAKWRHELKP